MACIENSDDATQFGESLLDNEDNLTNNQEIIDSDEQNNGVHDFKDIIDSERNVNNNNQKTAVVVLGEAGVGKSYLVGVLSGNDVSVSHGVEHGQQKCTLYESKDHDDIQYWMDTKGTGDADVPDSEILQKIVRKLHSEKVTHIKIVWMLRDGTINRTNTQHKAQAQFIADLGNWSQIDSHKDIWESCVIIKKQPSKLNVSYKNIQGAIADAKKHGLKLDFKHNRDLRTKHIFGFTAIDAMRMNDDNDAKNSSDDDDDDDDDTDDDENSVDGAIRAHEKMIKKGLLNKNDIINETMKRLNKIEPFNLQFVEQKCSRCGIISDARCVIEQCHSHQEMYHPGKYKSIGFIKSLKKIKAPGGGAVTGGALGFVAVEASIIIEAATFTIVLASGPVGIAIATGATVVGGIATIGYGQVKKEWSCCQTKAHSTNTGCKARCQRCKRDWGTGPCGQRQ